MLARTLRARSAARGLSFVRAYSTPNDPVKRDVPQTVSETNATPTSSEGSFDKVLQESVARAEEFRTAQAPNYKKGTWSTSQQARAVAMQGPRFEQTIMEDQVCGASLSLSIALEMGHGSTIGASESTLLRIASNWAR